LLIILLQTFSLNFFSRIFFIFSICRVFLFLRIFPVFFFLHSFSHRVQCHCSSAHMGWVSGIRLSPTMLGKSIFAPCSQLCMHVKASNR
jgi:hypothetical protein